MYLSLFIYLSQFIAILLSFFCNFIYTVLSKLTFYTLLISNVDLYIFNCIQNFSFKLSGTEPRFSLSYFENTDLARNTLPIPNVCGTLELLS